MNHDFVSNVPTDGDLQTPFDAAIVITSILRPTLLRAVRSVYRQQFPGRIQVLVGIDKPVGDRGVLEQLARECPEHCALTVIDPGYSTSFRHGGVYPGASGGAMRTVLSYLANSRVVAYLDDDNWFGEDHVRTMREALAGHDYAFSLRWFVERETGEPYCVDEWESVGPNAGTFLTKFGGFIDTNCLMVDKLRCDEALRWWCCPLPGDIRAMSEDRMVFDCLRRNHRGRGTGAATCYYVINPEDCMHPMRTQWIASKTTAPARV
jgi:hypothetical protein